MDTIQKFRKNPVVIEAVQWTGENTSEVCRFGTEAIGTPLELRKVRPNAFFHKLCVETLEGYLDASPGDWIIKGVKGEFYPCKPDIFAATYEPADSRDPAKLEGLLEELRKLKAQCDRNDYENALDMAATILAQLQHVWPALAAFEGMGLDGRTWDEVPGVQLEVAPKYS